MNRAFVSLALGIIVLLQTGCGKPCAPLSGCASGAQCCQVASTTGNPPITGFSSFCVSACSGCAAYSGPQVLTQCPAIGPGNLEGCTHQNPNCKSEGSDLLRVDGDLFGALESKQRAVDVDCDKECVIGDDGEPTGNACVSFRATPSVRGALSNISGALVVAKNNTININRGDLLVLFGMQDDSGECPNADVRLGPDSAEFKGEECEANTWADSSSGPISINYTVKSTTAERVGSEEDVRIVFDENHRPTVSFEEVTGRKRRALGVAIEAMKTSRTGGQMQLLIGPYRSCIVYPYDSPKALMGQKR